MINKMNAPKGLLVGLSLAVCMAGAYAQQPPAPALADTVLAKGADGEMVRWQDIMTELQKAPPATRQEMLSRPDSVQQLVNNIMLRRLLVKQALHSGLDKRPDVVNSLELMRDKILAEAQVLSLDAKNVPAKEVLEKNIQDAYKAKMERFVQPAETHARHILLDATAPDALDKANAMVATIRAGEPFEALAKTASLDTVSGAKGGDLGFFAAGRMVPEFEAGLDKLTEPGQVSDPILTKFGYHIIQLVERREKRQLTLAEVHDQLANEVTSALQKNARQAEVKRLTDAFTIDKAAIEQVVQSVAQPAPAAPQ